jgi:ATP-dependent Clp protease ATP-binding subunit ClpC
VFERFTERARQVVVLAQDEARALRHGYIGTEHLLLGLLREEEGLASRTLGSLGVELHGARGRVSAIVGEGTEVARGLIPFLPDAKQSIDGALREALKMGHRFIGTEHLLLGLVREEGYVSSRVLAESGVTLAQVRERVLALLSGE